MSDLVIECPSKETKRDDARVVFGIARLLSEHYEQKGIGGKWKMRLFRKTGGGGQERLVFRKLIDDPGGNQPVLMYQVRPLDRDSSWTVLLYPPPGCNLKDIVSLENAPSLPPETQVETPVQEEDVSESLCDNQVYVAKVSAHKEHGLLVEIAIEDEKVLGFVPLSDLDYDKQLENKYRVGKNVKVLVADSSKSPVVCSIRGAIEMTSSDSLKDVFTGAPNKNGSLSLRGYTLSGYQKIYELVEDLALSMLDSDPPYLSKEKAVDAAIEYWKKKYNVPVVERSVTGTILNQLCKGTKAVPVPLLCHQGDGYSLTEFALNELDLSEKPQSAEASPVILSEQPKSVPAEPVAESEPDPVTETDEQHLSAKQTDMFLDHNPIPETTEQPDATVEPVVEQAQPSTPEISPEMVKEAALYFGKASRFAEISSQLSSLQTEHEDLAAWLEKNKDLRKIAQAVKCMADEMASRLR